MEGYILINIEGNRLTRDMYWYDGEGWVWTEPETSSILKQAERDDWQYKPCVAKRAKYVPETGVIIVGASYDARDPNFIQRLDDEPI